MSSAVLAVPWNAYGAMIPTCTPPHFEFGFACAKSADGRSAAAGTPSASFPISRLV
jgi:hypothetical protein